MKWLILALSLAPPEQPAVEVQRPGEAVLWALDWDAPPSCATREEVVAAVRGYLPELEAPPLQVPRAELRIDVTIEDLDGEWLARLELSGRLGAATRSLSAESCKELADAVALVAAVSLDPVIVASDLARSRDAAAPELTRPPEPEPPSSELEPPTPTTTRAEPPAELQATSAGRPTIGLRLLGGGGYGPTRTGYGALAIGLAVFARSWRWSLDGGGWLPRVFVREQGGGRFSGWWIGSRGCFVPALRRRPGSARGVEFPVCAGLELGQVLARGLAPAVNTRSAGQPWIAASLASGASWVISERVALLVDAAALLPFVRGSFEVGDVSVQALTPVGVRAGLGCELRF